MTWLLNALDAFSTATGADVAWHVNPAFRDAQGHFDVDAAPAPSSASTLLLYEELHEKPPRPTKQKLPIVDGGVQASASSMARDFASLRKRYNHHTIVGLLNQDTDQSTAWTDAVYRASKNSIDVVAFSYYASTVALGRAKKKYGCGAYADAALGIVDPSHRSAFDRTLAHYVELARSLGKFVWVVARRRARTPPRARAGARSTPSRAGSGTRFDALGRAAAGGARRAARGSSRGRLY